MQVHQARVVLEAKRNVKSCKSAARRNENVLTSGNYYRKYGEKLIQLFRHKRQHHIFRVYFLNLQYDAKNYIREKNLYFL